MQAAAIPLPDFCAIREELSRKGVTRRLLWQEYRAREPRGLEYSQFCELHRRRQKTKDVVMRFEHIAGDKVFVDYAGLTIAIIDRRTGTQHPAQVFVAALGHSPYTFAEAATSQQVVWLASHLSRSWAAISHVRVIRPPGHIVMWRGISRLPDIPIGYKLAINDMEN